MPGDCWGNESFPYAISMMNKYKPLHVHLDPLTYTTKEGFQGELQFQGANDSPVLLH